MATTRWAQIQAALDEFQVYLSQAVPELNLEVALGPGEVLGWDQPRVLRLPGVYLFFDAAERLLLVGCSTLVMRDRVASHLKEDVLKNARSSGWIDVIPLNPRWFFFAPALEAYLIWKCNPKHNRQLVCSALNNECRVFMEDRHGIAPA